uniref:Uncharacterized protein n=1 Tax=Cannabis sativa TaxID=3483 RepID=A0A803QRT4_CANSA
MRNVFSRLLGLYDHDLKRQRCIYVALIDDSLRRIKIRSMPSVDVALMVSCSVWPVLPQLTTQPLWSTPGRNIRYSRSLEEEEKLIATTGRFLGLCPGRVQVMPGPRAVKPSRPQAPPH